MSTTQLIQCWVTVWIWKQKETLTNLFFEGSVPALMQTLYEQEEILIFLLKHCVGILYGLWYKVTKG